MKKKKKKFKSTFSALRKGTRVYDIWYGRGVVVRKLKTRVDIRMGWSGQVKRYDIPHINTFIRLMGDL